MERRAIEPRLVRDLRRLHADSRVRNDPRDKQTDQYDTDSGQDTLYHRLLLPSVPTETSRRGAQQIYFAMAMAGVGYFVRSVTVIWNRFDRTAKASWFQLGTIPWLTGYFRIE